MSLWHGGTAEPHYSCMWGEELSSCYQGKRAREQQVHVLILVMRLDIEISVPQARSLTATGMCVHFDITCSLLQLFWWWTIISKPLKLFCTHTWHWTLPNSRCLFISGWAYCCSLFRWTCSMRSWKHFSVYWSEDPYEPGSMKQGIHLPSVYHEDLSPF